MMKKKTKISLSLYKKGSSKAKQVKNKYSSEDEVIFNNNNKTHTHT